MRTDLSKIWGNSQYHSNDRPSLTVEAHEWLAKQSGKAIGVDVLVTERDYGVGSPVKLRDPSLVWPADCLMMKYDFYIIENLTNLGKIPKPYFTFIGFPLNFAGAAASPLRAVTVVD